MNPSPSMNDSFFSGVSIRLFPLRADPATLQNFIDRYLNRPELNGQHYFRSQNSYVMLSILNYTKMSDSVSQLGYLSQNEVMFSIPLQWYMLNPQGRTLHDGKNYSLLMHQDTSTAPHIFVDNDRSAVGGRELFGWPKLPMKLQPDVSQWLEHPENKERLLTVKVALYDELFKQRRREVIPLIQINRATSATLANPMEKNLQAAQDFANGCLPASALAEHRQLHDRYWTKEAQQQLAHLDPATASMAAQAGLSEQAAFEAAQNRPLLGRTRNNIGLKQFPHADDPTISAYQALGNSVSTIEHVRGQGLLGRQGTELDVSGGYEVCIREVEQLPVVQQLGLMTSQRKGRWHTLQPIAPSWVDVDIGYSAAAHPPLFLSVHGRPVNPNVVDLPEFRSEYRRSEEGEVLKV